MKGILEFDLNDPDDIAAHLRAVKSLNMALALWDIVYNAKKGLERQIENALEEDKNFTPYDSLDIIYDRIWEILGEYDVNIDRLVK
jgi:hypothetical protein